MSQLKISAKSFDGFGPSLLARTARGQLRGMDLPQDRMDARRMLRECCPREAGVYGWLDPNGQLVYVGKSKSLRHRLLSYFALNPSDDKMLRIRQNSHSIVWEPVANELLALVREQELIHRWRPQFNRQGQPVRLQPAFLCISQTAAPHAFMAKRQSPKAGIAFGPIQGTGKLREAIESFNHVFRLRDCPDKTRFEFSNQLRLFDNQTTALCIRHELGTCPGPCAALCSRGSYQQQVDDAIRFLRGEDTGALDELKRQMVAAAASLSFERAASLRDHYNQLAWLDRRLSALRIAEQTLDGVLRIPARRQGHIWLVLRNGRLVTTVAEPTANSLARSRVHQLIEDVARRRSDMPASLLEISLQLLLASWFRKNPDDRKHIIDFATALRELPYGAGVAHKKTG